EMPASSSTISTRADLTPSIPTSLSADRAGTVQPVSVRVGGGPAVVTGTSIGSRTGSCTGTARSLPRVSTVVGDARADRRAARARPRPGLRRGPGREHDAAAEGGTP